MNRYLIVTYIATVPVDAIHHTYDISLRSSRLTSVLMTGVPRKVEVWPS